MSSQLSLLRGILMSSQLSLLRGTLMSSQLSLLRGIKQKNVNEKRTKNNSIISLVQFIDPWRQSRRYQKSIKVERICCKGRFWAWSEGVMDTERDGLISEWGEEMNRDWWDRLNESGKWFQRWGQSVSQCNAWPATGRSTLQDLRSCAILQASLALSPVSSSICSTHVRRGHPRWCFHSGLMSGLPRWCISKWAICDFQRGDGWRARNTDEEWVLQQGSYGPVTEWATGPLGVS